MKPRGFPGMKSVRQGGSVLVMSLLMLGILAMINYIGVRRHARFDLTAEDRFSLSAQTRQVLGGLEAPVSILAFYPADDPQQVPLRRLLDEYRAASERVEVEFIDPDQEPGRAGRYSVREPGVIVTTGERRQPARTTGEEGITNAILRVLSERPKRVGFLVGHGERDPGGRDREGYSSAVLALGQASYVPSRVSPLLLGSLPESTDVLVIAGPRSEPLPEEVKALDGYLAAGGRILAFLDPAPSAGLDSLFFKWGVVVGNDRVVDPGAGGRLVGLDEFSPIVARYEDTPITRGFSFATFYPLARSIEPRHPLPAEAAGRSLFRTSGGSWSETSPDQVPPRLDPGIDRLGPVGLAAMIQHGAESGARLVVFGDSDFIANKYWRLPGSGDLFLNAVAWLSERPEEIAVRAPSNPDRRVELTAEGARTVFLSGVVFLPLAIAAAGFWVGWRRHGR